MNHFIISVLVLSIIFLAVSCGSGDGGTPPAAEEFTGNWWQEQENAAGEIEIIDIKDMEASIVQIGTSLSGTITLSGSSCPNANVIDGTLSGSVEVWDINSGNNEVWDINFDSVTAVGTTAVSFSGKLYDDNPMSGTYSVFIGDCEGETGIWSMTKSEE